METWASQACSGISDEKDHSWLLPSARVNHDKADGPLLSDFSLYSPGELNFQAAVKPVSRYVLPLLQVFFFVPFSGLAASYTKGFRVPFSVPSP